MSKWIVNILGLICLLSSCEQRNEAAVQALIREKVAANTAQFEDRKKKECFKKTMEEAILVADSIVIARALAAKDTSQLIRPIKPSKPTIVIPKDDTPIAPLFKENGE